MYRFRFLHCQVRDGLRVDPPLFKSKDLRMLYRIELSKRQVHDDIITEAAGDLIIVDAILCGSFCILHPNTFNRDISTCSKDLAR